MRREIDCEKAKQVATIMAQVARQELSTDQIADSVIIVECFQSSGSSRTFVGRRCGIIDEYYIQAGLSWLTAAARKDAQAKIDAALPTDLPIWVLAHLTDGHLFSSVMVTRTG